MKINAELNSETKAVDIKREGHAVFAAVDGRQYVLECSEPESNVFLLKTDNKIYEAVVSPSLSNSFHVRVGGNEFDIRIIDPKRLRGSSGQGEASEGSSEIRTAMPGKVVRIVTPSGTEVKKGDPVIVVEAMKMQNEMKSPKDGIVKDIRASEGSTVNAGDVLAVIG